MTVNLLLKRNIKLTRIVLGAVVGSMTILFLFLNLNSVMVFFIKIFISILMILVTFKFQNIRYFISNFIYLYITSFVMGGFLYYINLEYSTRQSGLTFVYERIPLNCLILLALAPIILTIYIRSSKKLKIDFNNYHDVSIIIDKNHTININGFLDTGSNLKDPVSKKNIVLVINTLIKDIHAYPKIYVPYTTLNGHELLECIKGKEIIIDNKRSKNILIGISKNDFNMNGIGCIISNAIMEDLK